jgi:hypothetical protein
VLGWGKHALVGKLQKDEEATIPCRLKVQLFQLVDGQLAEKV